MDSNFKYNSALKTSKSFITMLLVMAGLLGILHFVFADVEAGGVYWFNLDKERNLPTWFSGMLFFFFGVSALTAFFWEIKQNQINTSLFNLPVLWLGVALVGFAMSLDEITILHENLFWKEVRNTSSQLDDSMKYVTQWQIVFAPAIFLILGYFGLFFINRFGASRRALIGAFSGITLWIIALLLEGIRQTFINAGPEFYSLQVLSEELLEMTGAILLLYSVVMYTIDIALDLNKERIEKLSRAAKLLTKKSALAFGVIFLTLVLSAGIIYQFAKEQSNQKAPVPTLFKKAVNK